MPTTERAGVERPNRAPRRTSSALSNLSPAGSGLLRSTHKQHGQRQACAFASQRGGGHPSARLTLCQTTLLPRFRTELRRPAADLTPGRQRTHIHSQSVSAVVLQAATMQ